jgi:ATP-dependent Zn protease
MNWNWEPDRWKKSTKVLLAIATVWPPIYMVLFVLVMFSFVLLIPFEDRRANRNSKDIDLIQLDRKIRNGEIKELTLTPSEVIAVDRVSNVEYRTYVSNESTREEIIKEAREQDANGRPRVDKIEEKNNQAPSALLGSGFVGLFAAHLITMLLIMGLMPFYIILAVKSDRLDQTMRIVWVVLICMLGMFAMPVYWYLYIWRNGPPAGTVEISS